MNTFGIIAAAGPLTNITVTMQGSRAEAQKRLNKDVGDTSYPILNENDKVVTKRVPSSLKLFPIS